VKKALVMLLVVALFCTSLHVTLSESEEIVGEEIVSEAVDAVVEEVDGFFLGDAWPDEAPELPEALPVIAGETPEVAEPVDADLQAGGEALPLSVEGVDAAEEVPGTGEPEAPAEGGTAAGDADTVALPEDGGDGTPAEGAGEAETPAEADAGEGLEGDAEATVAQAEEGQVAGGGQAPGVVVALGTGHVHAEHHVGRLEHVRGLERRPVDLQGGVGVGLDGDPLVGQVAAGEVQGGVDMYELDAQRMDPLAQTGRHVTVEADTSDVLSHADKGAAGIDDGQMTVLTEPCDGLGSTFGHLIIVVYQSAVNVKKNCFLIGSIHGMSPPGIFQSDCVYKAKNPGSWAVCRRRGRLRQH